MAVSWYALMAPAKTPQPIIEKLAGEVARIVKLPDVIDDVDGLGGGAGRRHAGGAGSGLSPRTRRAGQGDQGGRNSAAVSSPQVRGFAGMLSAMCNPEGVGNMKTLLAILTTLAIALSVGARRRCRKADHLELGRQLEGSDRTDRRQEVQGRDRRRRRIHHRRHHRPPEQGQARQGQSGKRHHVHDVACRLALRH